MGQIADRAEAMRPQSIPPRLSPRAILLTTTALHIPQPPHDYADERISIGGAYLGRIPHRLHHPFDGSVFWVESEPDDWRNLIEGANAARLTAEARKAREMH